MERLGRDESDRFPYVELIETDHETFFDFSPKGGVHRDSHVRSYLK